jgi:protein-S-isoprenylcysteine O-methyltransferase Ste14
MLALIPFLAFASVLFATVIRGVALRLRSGDNPWAFAKPGGIQRWTRSAFALSILVLGVASARTTVRGDADYGIAPALIAFAGSIMVLIAQHQMGRAWRIGVREGDAPFFVSKGLFRISRNPVFVGMILMGLGIALSANDWWSWCAWVAFVGSCRLQVAIEERHLVVNFGQRYLDFQTKVPRWIGF